MSFDLSDFDLVAIDNKGAELDLTYPRGAKKGEPTGVKIRVVGLHSDTFKKAQTEAARTLLSLNEKKDTIDTMDYLNQLKVIKTTMLAQCIIGWENLTEDGKPVEYSIVDAARILSKYEWILEQVDTFVANEANFIAG